MQETLVFDVRAAQWGVSLILLGALCVYIAWKIAEMRNRIVRRRVREQQRAVRQAETKAAIGKRIAQLLREIETRPGDEQMQRRLKDAWLEFREVANLGPVLGELLDALQEQGAAWNIKLSAAWQVLQRDYGMSRSNRL